MQCREVVELLSAYYDGELSPERLEAVSEHVADCDSCASELATLHKLSDLTAQLDQPTPPRHVWPRIAAKLNANEYKPDAPASAFIPSAAPIANPNSLARASGLSAHKTLLAIGALLLFGVSWLAYSHWHAREHQQLAVNFSRFLDSFEQAPADAQRDLMHHYSGVPVEMTDAIRELKYRPVVADGLPDDYEPAQAYLLKMPCCRCLEACYHRADGGMLCVFEHDEDQPVWFGERPMSSKMCSGKATRLVQLHGSLAATWQQDRRHITVIGAKDTDEVARLVGHFNQNGNHPHGL